MILAKARLEPDHRHEGSIVGGDFYRVADLLSAEDQSLLRRVRTFMEEEVAPVITKYWTRAEFPFELIPGYAALGVAGAAYSGYGCAGRSALLDGFVMLEMARVDASIATFFGVQSGLAMGSIYLLRLRRTAAGVASKTAILQSHRRIWPDGARSGLRAAAA